MSAAHRKEALDFSFNAFLSINNRMMPRMTDRPLNIFQPEARGERMRGFLGERKKSHLAIVRATAAVLGRSKGVSHTLLAGWAVATLASGCARNVSVSTYAYSAPRIAARLSPTDGAYTGKWSGAEMGRQGGHLMRLMEIVVLDGASESTHRTWMSDAEIEGFPKTEGDTALQFSVRRNAGTMAFTGERLGGKSSGEVRFTVGAEFAKQAKDVFGVAPTAAQALASFWEDLPADYARSMRACGAAKTLDDALKLRRCGVSSDYARKLRDGGSALDAEDIVRVNRHGIGAGFVTSLHCPPPAPKEPAAVKGIEVAQPRGYSIDEIVDLNRHGISLQQVDTLREMGYSPPAKEIIKYNRHGISNAYVRKLCEAGLKYPIDDLIELNRHGIAADYILKIRKIGYDFPVADLIELNRHGVPENYMAALIVPGQKNLTAAQIIELKRHGIDAEFAKKLRVAK